MIAEVAEAIRLKYDASTSLVKALPDGLFYEQATQGLSGSYGVFFIIGIVRNEIMGSSTDGIEQIDVQFNLFSNTDDGGYHLDNIIDELDATFNWQNMTLNGYSQVKFNRESITLLPIIDGYRQATVMYELWIEKA